MRSAIDIALAGIARAAAGDPAPDTLRMLSAELAELLPIAETGEQHAEICRLEDLIEKDRRRAHLAVGEFSLCQMGTAYSGFQCEFSTVSAAEAELERIRKAGPTNMRVVLGECPAP